MDGRVAIPEWYCRSDGLLGLARRRRAAALALMDTVLRGFGSAGLVLRPLLPLGDRLAARHLAAIGDPFRDDILALPALLGRPGAVAFSLSYEFACTTRVFETGAVPVLMRVLDWPFLGLGQRVEIVHLSGPAGDWVTATWPGVMGALHGAAPGRFAVAMNQAPERQGGFGRAADWLGGRRRLLKGRGMPPPRLLRQVFEQAPDYAAACAMLAATPVAVPVIFALAGIRQSESCVIERTETGAARPNSAPTAAANHFTTALGEGRWRGRGIDSPGRHRAACALAAAPEVDALPAPILNRLTRLALVLDASGRLEVAGWEGDRPVSGPRRAAPPAA